MLFSGTFGGSDGKRPVPQGATAADEGWTLCDGTNGTPDLRGKFIIGAGGEYAAGATGGAASATVSGTTGATTLTVAQMPKHKHTGRLGPGTSHNVSSGSTYPPYNDSYTGETGGSGSHTHSMSATVSTLPPYYALCYIMKLAG